MLYEDLIDLNRRDLLTAAIYQIVLATIKREETIGVYTPDISCFEPSIDI